MDLDDEKFVFPTDTIIESEAFLTIPKGEEAGEHLFGISSNGETLSLFDSGLNLMDSVTYEEDDAEISWCRIPDGADNWARCLQTFDTNNEVNPCGNGVLDSGEDCDIALPLDLSCADHDSQFTGGDVSCAPDCTFDLSMCTADLPCDASALVLNEVCHKDEKCGVAGVTTGDWMEIYNSSDATATLAECFIRISDEGVEEMTVQFAAVSGYENITIAPHDYLLVDDTAELFDAGNNHLIELLTSDGTTLINHLTTSEALVTDGDTSSGTCSIDETGDIPTPGTTNQCQ